METFSAILCVIALICYLCFGWWQPAIAGALVNLLAQFYELGSGRQKNITTMIVAVVSGWILAGPLGLRWWQSIAVCLCVESFLMSIGGIILVIKSMPKTDQKMPIWAFGIVSVVCVVAIGFCIYQGTIINNREITLNSQKAEIEWLKKSGMNKNSEIAELQKAVEFYEENVVIITSSGGKYHRYGCSAIKGRNIYPIYLEEAEEDGFSPCSICNPITSKGMSEKEILEKWANS